MVLKAKNKTSSLHYYAALCESKIALLVSMLRACIPRRGNRQISKAPEILSISGAYSLIARL
jgi:hypothetical protein